MYILIYFPNFGSIGLGPTGPSNVALGLKHWHNNLESLESLMGPLEGYPELSMEVDRFSYFSTFILASNSRNFV
jgi:hypothetical protein